MTEEQLHSIDALIRANGRFALWRVPGDSSFRFMRQLSSRPVCYEHIGQLNGARGFVIAPFSASAAQPIVLILPECETIDTDIPRLSPTKNGYEPLPCAPKERYEADFARCIEALQCGALQKVVLSRQKLEALPADFSPASAFLEAMARYPYSYVYLCHSPETGTWMGCSPERLLSGLRTHWQTVSLAATLPQQGDCARTWSDSHKTEQQLVTDYIHQQLDSFGASRVQAEAPCTVQAANLIHLRSNFSFELPNSARLGSLLFHLHPTPAVSGLPKADAFSFLLQHEANERGYYAGFMGYLDPEAQTDVYVNLRCMKLHETHAILYAGGGLLPSSVLEEEWKETEDKMKTMQSLIIHH